MLTAALDLAQQGWAVFPCHWRNDDRAKSPKTINGHHDATRDPDVITAWWSRWPRAMIGAPVPEAFAVVDLDPRNNPNCLAELENLVDTIPPTLTVWSGRRDGGRHWYFQRPVGAMTSTKLPRGVDLKVNGYCIVPPSIHPSTGQPYVWVHRPVASMPPGLRELLRPPPPRRWSGSRTSGSTDALTRWVESQGESNRNEGLYWAACRAGEAGQLDEIAADLVGAAVRAGLPEIEARRTVASAARRIGAHA